MLMKFITSVLFGIIVGVVLWMVGRGLMVIPSDVSNLVGLFVVDVAGAAGFIAAIGYFIFGDHKPLR